MVVEVRCTFLSSHSEFNGATQWEVVKIRWPCWSGIYTPWNKFETQAWLPLSYSSFFFSISAVFIFQTNMHTFSQSSKVFPFINASVLHSLLSNTVNYFLISKCPPFLSSPLFWLSQPKHACAAHFEKKKTNINLNCPNTVAWTD